ncbi:SCO family protein [Pseudoroseicyclus tamaricis]|uniref:SCO family protein n=1 Tax=Pseudoroseicyclus tamaricis TaxID=2705421 RepID=A0A6B2JHT6_9RHOB|nr:SCO family protein [Pseudoroseicyclus tamaricis]NDV00853.1 SCO family protein [Pseudoroseicyclus tamaricis]
MTTRTLNILLWAAVAVALLAGGSAWYLLSRGSDLPVAGTLGQGDYALTTTDGAPFTEEVLASGQPSAVFFGFTHCPDVCPTTLGDILTWQEELGDEAEDLRVYFVTVDPERDDPEVLGDYVSWVPGVAGVTGPRAEIDKATRAFGVYASRVPLEGGDYTMDHSAYVLLFDGNGNFVEPITYQEPLESALRKLRRAIGA